MRRGLLLLLVFCTAAVARDKSPIQGQSAVAVWTGKNCVVLLENVRATAPLIDGQPDYKNVHITGVALDNKCMSYEIRK